MAHELKRGPTGAEGSCLCGKWSVIIGAPVNEERAEVLRAFRQHVGRSKRQKGI